MQSSLQDLKNNFLEHLEIGQGRSSKTAHNYDYYIVSFFQKEHISTVEDITISKIRLFRRWLHDEEVEVHP